MSNWLRIGLYGGLHFVQLFTSLLTLGGIADQARYGPSNICILFIEDYQMDKSNPGYYLFSANSSACGGIIGLAAIGLVLALAIGGLSLYYIVRAEFRAVRLIFGMAVVAAVFTLLAIVEASIATAGINKTCSQFTSQGFQCSTVFSGGFFETDTQKTFGKSLGVINMAVVSAWFNAISWGAYAVLEFLNWRNSV
ncbi:hypothetical protein HDU96_003636 [Phlyctochytrium bullatum]|nr:hypothetical protein HDU96_003636 [Phlyctochytrium bullatum]